MSPLKIRLPAKIREKLQKEIIGLIGLTASRRYKYIEDEIRLTLPIRTSQGLQEIKEGNITKIVPTMDSDKDITELAYYDDQNKCLFKLLISYDSDKDITELLRR